jgi:hypothetical protein
MNSMILGRASSIGGFVARSLILPIAVCAALGGVLGGAALLGADLPDGTIHTEFRTP